jgi:hypothetical protein
VPFGVILSALAAGEKPLVDPRALRELSGSPDQRFWLLQELQDQVERAAASCPVMIMLDDLQWADEASLSAVATLPRHTASHRLLRRASARIGRVSPAVAAPLSRRALELTPGDDPSRGTQILETIEMLVLAGEAGMASRLLSASAEHLITAELEAETRLDMAMALMHYSPLEPSSSAAPPSASGPCRPACGCTSVRSCRAGSTSRVTVRVPRWRCARPRPTPRLRVRPATGAF